MVCKGCYKSNFDDDCLSCNELEKNNTNLAEYMQERDNDVVEKRGMVNGFMISCVLWIIVIGVWLM